jgi:hypothetical protein
MAGKATDEPPTLHLPATLPLRADLELIGLRNGVS